MAMSDRVLVVAHGRIVAHFTRAEASEVAIMNAAAGLRAAA